MDKYYLENKRTVTAVIDDLIKFGDFDEFPDSGHSKRVKFEERLHDELLQAADNEVIYHARIIEILSESKNLAAWEEFYNGDDLGDDTWQILGRIAFFAVFRDFEELAKIVMDEMEEEREREAK